jgi:predicted RNA-binding protein with TRAM domain
MEIPDQLRCLFSATVEQRDESYLIEVPEQEIRHDNLHQGETYRVAIFPSPSNEAAKSEPTDTTTRQSRQSDPEKPPVEEGETRRVEIDDIGDQGDGITRVERGFVVIVPDTEQGERVAIEITDVRENVAFADVVERVSYYD